MGRIHLNLKSIFDKIKRGNEAEIYQPLIKKFVTLLTYEDEYLMKRMDSFFVLRQNGNDMFIDCGGFGVIISPTDEISIHT